MVKQEIDVAKFVLPVFDDVRGGDDHEQRGYIILKSGYPYLNHPL